MLYVSGKTQLNNTISYGDKSITHRTAAKIRRKTERINHPPYVLYSILSRYCIYVNSYYIYVTHFSVVRKRIICAIIEAFERRKMHKEDTDLATDP